MLDYAKVRNAIQDWKKPHRLIAGVKNRKNTSPYSNLFIKNKEGEGVWSPSKTQESTKIFIHSI